MRLPALLALVVALVMGAPAVAAPAAAGKGDRVIRLHNIHTKETEEILFKKNGSYVKEGLVRASWLLRDWRRDEATEMDPALIDLLWELHAELGSQEPIHIISGYRSRTTNDMLRRTVGGQASESRHILGKAADVYFPDVPLKRLRYSAIIQERGGVGYYPTSGSPFVHLDTDRVRAWPRLPRPELALLFPKGQTQHVPADGAPLKPEDVRLAQVHQQDLVAEISAFRASRRDPAAVEARAVAVASAPARAVVARAEPPRLVQAPQPVARPAVAARVDETDREGLTTLAALAAGPEATFGAPAARARVGAPVLASFGPVMPPQLRAPEPAPAVAQRASPPVAWIPAPSWDDDHPEELSYRAFAVAPLLGDDAAQEPAILTQLKAPDLMRVLETLDQAETSPSVVLNPGRQNVRLAAAQAFRGAAVAVDTYFGRR
ncbi:MAG: DUF882 domain-containing protein [Hyphomicrobiaceae bacterium]